MYVTYRHPWPVPSLSAARMHRAEWLHGGGVILMHVIYTKAFVGHWRGGHLSAGALEFHTQQCAVHFSSLVTTFSAGLSGLDYDEKSGSTLNVIVVFEELFP